MFSSEEKEAFLPAELNAVELELGTNSRGRTIVSGAKCSTSHQMLSVFQIGLFVLNILTLGFNVVSSSRGCEPNDTPIEGVFSPAQPAIKYISQRLGYDLGPLTGEPRLELDQAWSRLLRSSMLIISQDELEKMNKSSIALRDGSGYVGYLEAHHMLHCVKRLYQLQHPEYYLDVLEYGSLTSEHSDHCFQVLIEGIMCNVDVTLNTYFWLSSHEIKGNRTGSRKCTDWNHLQAWADERTLRASGKEEFLASLVQRDELEGVGSTYD
ncbi:hypothetical protein F5Y10DRAFT_289256 [Nemania abortiva]|nr:hypothetical protein F5Y10DRAFT_289256 [Nemania abortiva]